tara:strand:+ start:369 stop:731 length:363 start_codon:yes stop_codon:yes gene_type:complete
MVQIFNDTGEIYRADLDDEQTWALITYLKVVVEEMDGHIDVIQRVCRYFDISPKMLSEKNRKVLLVKARAIVCYRLVTAHGYTLMKTATIVGYTNHTTVAHALKSVENEHMSDYKNIFYI